MNDVNGTDYHRKDDVALSYIYASFFAVLGLFLFVLVLFLTGGDFFSFAVVAGLFAIVTSVLYIQARQYPHNREVGIAYLFHGGLPVAAVAALTLILNYFWGVAAALISSILFLVIPIIILRGVQTEYPSHADYTPSGGGKEGVASAEGRGAADGYRKERSAVLTEAAFSGEIAVIMSLAIFLYYSENWVLIILTAVLFLIYQIGFGPSGNRNMHKHYEMLDGTRKKYLFSFIVLLIISFGAPLFFVNNISQHMVWTLVFVAASLAVYYGLRHRKHEVVL